MDNNNDLLKALHKISFTNNIYSTLVQGKGPTNSSSYSHNPRNLSVHWRRNQAGLPNHELVLPSIFPTHKCIKILLKRLLVRNQEGKLIRKL